LSDFLLDLRQSLAHQGFATDFSKIGLDISMGMPDEDPEPFPGWFSQTHMHQDLSISLRKKSLNLGLSLSAFLPIKIIDGNS